MYMKSKLLSKLKSDIYYYDRRTRTFKILDLSKCISKKELPNVKDSKDICKDVKGHASLRNLINKSFRKPEDEKVFQEDITYYNDLSEAFNCVELARSKNKTTKSHGELYISKSYMFLDERRSNETRRHSKPPHRNITSDRVETYITQRVETSEPSRKLSTTRAHSEKNQIRVLGVYRSISKIFEPEPNSRHLSNQRSNDLLKFEQNDRVKRSIYTDEAKLCVRSECVRNYFQDCATQRTESMKSFEIVSSVDKALKAEHNYFFESTADVYTMTNLKCTCIPRQPIKPKCLCACCNRKPTAGGHMPNRHTFANPNKSSVGISTNAMTQDQGVVAEFGVNQETSTFSLKNDNRSDLSLVKTISKTNCAQQKSCCTQCDCSLPQCKKTDAVPTPEPYTRPPSDLSLRSIGTFPQEAQSKLSFRSPPSQTTTRESPSSGRSQASQTCITKPASPARSQASQSCCTKPASPARSQVSQTVLSPPSPSGRSQASQAVLTPQSPARSLASQIVISPPSPSGRSQASQVVISPPSPSGRSQASQATLVKPTLPAKSKTSQFRCRRKPVSQVSIKEPRLTSQASQISFVSAAPSETSVRGAADVRQVKMITEDAQTCCSCPSCVKSGHGVGGFSHTKVDKDEEKREKEDEVTSMMGDIIKSFDRLCNQHQKNVEKMLGELHAQARDINNLKGMVVALRNHKLAPADLKHHLDTLSNRSASGIIAGEEIVQKKGAGKLEAIPHGFSELDLADYGSADYAAIGVGRCLVTPNYLSKEPETNLVANRSLDLNELLDELASITKLPPMNVEDGNREPFLKCIYTSSLVDSLTSLTQILDEDGDNPRLGSGNKRKGHEICLGPDEPIKTITAGDTNEKTQKRRRGCFRRLFSSKSKDKPVKKTNNRGRKKVPN